MYDYNARQNGGSWKWNYK